MSDELHGNYSPVEGPDAGTQNTSPLGSHSPECSPEHGLREGASGPPDPPRDTRPDRATRYLETTLGILSYSDLAPLLAERVQRLEESVQKEEFVALPLDETLVCEFHRRICDDLVPDWAGKWRSIEVTVGPLTPPPPYQLPMLMRDYTLDLQARWASAADDLELTIEYLAFAEGRFLSIHPFRDFNGRTIRVLLAEILRRLDLPLVDLAPDEESARSSYFAALEAADGHDLRPLIDIWKIRFTN